MLIRHGAPPILQLSCIEIFVTTDKFEIVIFFCRITCDGTENKYINVHKWGKLGVCKAILPFDLKTIVLISEVSTQK